MMNKIAKALAAPILAAGVLGVAALGLFGAAGGVSGLETSSTAHVAYQGQ